LHLAGFFPMMTRELFGYTYSAVNACHVPCLWLRALLASETGGNDDAGFILASGLVRSMD
jgi:hypothetical protein